jgi:hypothetical protein
MKRSILPWAALVAIGAAAPATAQLGEAESADIDCLAATMIMSDRDGNAPGSPGTVGMMFYLGKVSARGIDFGGPLEAALTGMTEDELHALAQRCGGEISAMGERLQRSAEEMAN